MKTLGRLLRVWLGLSMAMTALAATIPAARVAVAAVRVSAPSISADSTLANLQVKDVALAPIFTSTVLIYTSTVGYEVSSVVVTPTKSAISASWAITSPAGVCASGAAAATCTLVAGQNTLTVTVTDGPSTTDYQIVLRRPVAGHLSGFGSNLTGDHMCAYLEQDYRMCWGFNSSVQFGDGGQQYPNGSTTPVTVTAIRGVMQESYYGNKCVLLEDTTVRCAGATTNGLLGFGSLNATNILTPMVYANGQVISDVEQVATNNGSSCVLINGKIWCWGRNDQGHMGEAMPPFVTVLTPTLVPDFDNVTEIGQSIYGMCALISNGTVRCVGGQVRGDGTVSGRTVVTVPTMFNGPPLTGVVDISVGSYVACAVLVDTSVKCWGTTNTSGGAGNGTTAPVTVPASVIDSVTGQPITGVVKLSTTGETSCALLNTGYMKCWGGNSVGQLGNGTLDDALSAVDVLDAGGRRFGNVVDIGIGGGSCAQTGDRNIYCWGAEGPFDFFSDYSIWPIFTHPQLVISGTLSSDPTLRSLKLSDGALEPRFVSSTTRYTTTVAYDVDHLVVTPKTRSIFTVYTTTATPNAATGDDVPLSVGWNLVTVSVRAETGATETYVTAIMREPPSDATLADLTLEAPAALEGKYVSTTARYTGSVPIGTSSAMLHFTTTVATGAREEVLSSAGGCESSLDDAVGAAGCEIDPDGTTWITVTITAADDTTTEQYFLVIVAKAPSSDATLADLTLEAPAVLEGKYVSTTTRYTGSVPIGTSSATLHFTTTVATGAREEVLSSAGGCESSLDDAVGAAGCEIDPDGTTWITVTITAADDTTTEQYFLVIVAKQPSSDATLSGLEIAPGTLNPSFVSGTTDYAATVPNGTTSAVVTATTNDAGATVAYASSAGVCAGSVASCDVAAPKTWITATVTAADGTTKEEYVIEITVADANASDDASLADLTITPGELTPSFVSGTTEYATTVPAGTTSAAVTATPNDPAATVAYASSAGACTTPGLRGVGPAPAWTCDVAAPKTWITATVTAANGDVQEYVIEVTVAAGLTTIDRVWPGSGVPEGGMPVSIFGTGFVEPLTVTVGPYDGEMLVVTPTSVTATRIDFVMPAGTAGQYVSVTVATAADAQTAANAFLYVAPVTFEVDGEVGGEFVTPDGLTITVPAQGVSGSFYLTMTPLPPAPGVPGNILMYSFRLDAVLNGTPLASLTNPVTIQLPIDEGIFAIQDGERPWLYSWTADGGRPTAAKPTTDDGRRQEK